MKNYITLINIYKYAKSQNESDKYYPSAKNIKVIKQFDNAISAATLKYLIIIQLINKLYNNIKNSNNQSMENKTDKFFTEFGFSDSQKALFFLGKLIRRVAIGQSKQKHEHKPILNKINYSGMKVNDIKWLSCEVYEKMKQYNKSQNTFNFGEKDLNQFNQYFCRAERVWNLTEMENVFYLFTGYGMYWDTIEEKEKEILSKEGIDEQKVDISDEVEELEVEQTDEE